MKSYILEEHFVVAEMVKRKMQYNNLTGFQEPDKAKNNLTEKF